MKIRSTFFGALLLCAALIVPTSADTADQGKSQEKDKKQTQEQSQSERGKATEAERKTDRAEIAPGEPLTDEEALNDWQEWWDFQQGKFDTGDFAGMDKDEDQAISREEWAGSFALFDRDHDGMISQKEYEDREYRGLTREALFGKMDLNANGRLEPSEWWWSRDAFALVDRDSNGWITPEELVHRGEPQPR